MKSIVRQFFSAGKLLRRAQMGIAILLSFGLAVLPARACCDDFLSCAAAVATGGLSCAAEAALKAITDAISELQQDRSTTVTEFNAALDPQVRAFRKRVEEIDEQIKRLLAQIEKAGVDGGVVPAAGLAKVRSGAAQIAEGYATGAKDAPTNKRVKSHPGDSVGKKLLLEQDLENSPSLAGLRAELAALVVKKDQILEELHDEMAQAAAQELAAESRAKQVLDESFLGHIDRALGALENAVSHPLDVGDDVRDALSLLNTAQDGFFDVLTPALNQAGSDIDGAIQVPFAFLLSIEKEARRADELVAAIQKMTAVSSEPERSAIAMQLDNTPPNPSAVRPTNGHKLSPKSFSAMKTRLTRQSESARAALERAAAPHPAENTSGYRAQLANDFDSYFKGVPAAAAQRKRDELIAEAKVRYAKDPATLKALEKYLRDEARVRGVD